MWPSISAYIPITLLMPFTYPFTVYGYRCASGDSGVVPEVRPHGCMGMGAREVRLLVDVGIPDFFHPRHSPWIVVHVGLLSML